MFELPADWIKTKRHLVRVTLDEKISIVFYLVYFLNKQFETLIQPGNENYLHHWLFYECSVEWETISINYNFKPQPKNCFKIDQFQADTEWPQVENFCRKISLSYNLKNSLKYNYNNYLFYLK